MTARTGSPEAIHSPIPVAMVPSMPARPRFATAFGAAAPGWASRSRRRTVMDEPSRRLGAPGAWLASHTARARASGLLEQSGSGRSATARRQESVQAASALSRPSRAASRATASSGS